MNERKQGCHQVVAAARAGLSERCAHRIDKGELTTSPNPLRHWRTREDPLLDVWQGELVPLLEANPALLPMTLLDYLDDNYPGRCGHSIHRTLQRRVKAWRAQHGPAKGLYVQLYDERLEFAPLRSWCAIARFFTGRQNICIWLLCRAMHNRSCVSQYALDFR